MGELIQARLEEADIWRRFILFSYAKALDWWEKHGHIPASEFSADDAASMVRDLLNEIERYDTALDEIGIYPRSVSGGTGGYEERTEYMNGWNACIMLIRIRLAELAEGKDFSKERQHILDECKGAYSPELMIPNNIWFGE